MLFLFQHEYDVALDHVRNLLSFLLKRYSIAILHPLLDVKSKRFAFLHDPFAFTRFTVFCIDSSFATTLITWLLHLHLHHAHVYSLHGDTSPFTNWAFFSFTAFSARTLAFAAVYVSIDVERLSHSIV